MSNCPWKCPRCEKMNAPWMPHCYCVPIELTKTEQLRKIAGETWKLLFTDENGEIIEGLITDDTNIPEVIQNILSINGKNISLTDRTPWRIVD